jgi:hypothetical protein
MPTSRLDRRDAYLEAGLAALALDDEATVQRLTSYVHELPPAMRIPLLRSGAARFEGLLAARHGDTRVADERLATAARELADVEAAFNLAQVLLDHAEVLHQAGREDEVQPLLDEALMLFQRLGAAPWLERAETLRSMVTA